MTIFVTQNGHLIGHISKKVRGFRFIPHNQRSPSRKDWPTPEASIPKWVGQYEFVEAPSALEAIGLIRQKSS